MCCTKSSRKKVTFCETIQIREIPSKKGLDTETKAELFYSNCEIYCLREEYREEQEEKWNQRAKRELKAEAREAIKRKKQKNFRKFLKEQMVKQKESRRQNNAQEMANKQRHESFQKFVTASRSKALTSSAPVIEPLEDANRKRYRYDVLCFLCLSFLTSLLIIGSIVFCNTSTKYRNNKYSSLEDFDICSNDVSSMLNLLTMIVESIMQVKKRLLLAFAANDKIIDSMIKELIMNWS
jgi:hypothetical protein